MEGDLTGNGHLFRVEWYHRGPFPGVQGNPPNYVRGVAVRSSGANSLVLARWNSGHTTLVDFYKTFNSLWPVRRGGGMLLTTLVQYGGAVYVLDALRFEHGELRRVSEVGGRGAGRFSLGCKTKN
jgi:hypothetical protein